MITVSHLQLSGWTICPEGGKLVWRPVPSSWNGWHPFPCPNLGSLQHRQRIWEFSSLPLTVARSLQKRKKKKRKVIASLKLLAEKKNKNEWGLVLGSKSLSKGEVLSFQNVWLHLPKGKANGMVPWTPGNETVCLKLGHNPLYVWGDQNCWVCLHWVGTPQFVAQNGKQLQGQLLPYYAGE